MIHFSIALLCAAGLAASHASAQLGVQVRALTDITVFASASPQQQTLTLPAGSDLSSGHSLIASAASGPPGNVVGSASSTGSTSRAGDFWTFELNEGASGGFTIFGPQGSGSWGPHQIEFVLDHPTARAFELVISRCIGPRLTQSSASGSVTLPDGRIIQGTPQASAFTCFFTPFAEVDRIPITLDQNGYRFVLETSGGAIGSSRGGNGSSRASWHIAVEPDPTRPCVAIEYGQGCGPVLNIVEDPMSGPFSHRAILDDPALPSAAWLVGGGLRTVLPLPPSCDLLNDALVIVPWPIDAQGHAELILAPTPGQTFALQLQAATFANGLRLSSGFEFACR